MQTLREHYGLEDKVAIVTGGTTGIGKATCEQLAYLGAKVYNLDIQNPKNEDLENITYVPCDVSNKEDVQEAVKYVYENEGGIDHLFSNAGIHFFGSIEETSDEDFDRVYGVNVKGTFYVLKEVLPIMKEQGRGSVVINGSDQTKIGKDGQFVYGSTKGAIGQMTKQLAINYAKYGIRVNCVCPGTIETPLKQKAVKGISEDTDAEEEINEFLANAQPIKRVGQPEEVARPVVFLLSDLASYMTGALVSIDGGCCVCGNADEYRFGRRTLGRTGSART